MKLKDAFSLCAMIRELLARSRKTNQLLTEIQHGQATIMSKADEIKAIQEQDLQEGRETAASGKAAIDRLAAKVTDLAAKVDALTADAVTDAQVAELKAASDDAKAESDAVQAAFDQAGS